MKKEGNSVNRQKKGHFRHNRRLSQNGAAARPREAARLKRCCLSLPGCTVMPRVFLDDHGKWTNKPSTPLPTGFVVKKE